jgi:hypothetical protein
MEGQIINPIDWKIYIPLSEFSIEISFKIK